MVFRNRHTCPKCYLDRATVADTLSEPVPDGLIPDWLPYSLALACPKCRPVIILWGRLFARRKFFRMRMEAI